MPDELSFDRAVVTGGAGFIGSHLVDLLVEANIETIVIDNLANGSLANVAHINGDKLRLEVYDIRDREQVRAILKPGDVVFHLACLGVRHSLHDPVENHHVNATGTLMLLEASRAVGIQRFVHVSTSEVYGTAETSPMTERHLTHPHTVYGGSKLAAESYARAFHLSWQLPTVVVRPFNAFGPRSHHEGDSGEVIPKMMLRALMGRPLIIFGDGRQTRDFSFVTDTARGILSAAGKGSAVGQTINLGTGTEIEIGHLAERIRKIVDADVPIEYLPSRPGDVHNLCADIGLARRYLDFAPKVSLDAGLSKLQAWYLESSSTLDDLMATEVIMNWLPPASPRYT